MTKLISKRGRIKAGTVVKVGLTKAEAAEILKCQNDPVYFIMSYIKVENSISGVYPIQIAKHHAEYIHAIHTSRCLIAMLPRQSGTSTVSMAYLLWEAMFGGPHQKVLVQSLSVNTTKILCDILSVMVQNLPPFMSSFFRAIRRTSIDFDNGSHLNINVTSPTALKGVTYSRIFIDCFAMLPPLIQKDLMVAISPGFAFNGRALLASTPNGKTNTFYNIWDDASKPLSLFTSFKRTVDDLPYTDAWKQMVKAQVGDAIWRREYMCEFL